MPDPLNDPVTRALRDLAVPAPHGLTDRVLAHITGGSSAEPPADHRTDHWAEWVGPAGRLFVAWNDRGVTRVLAAHAVEGGAAGFVSSYERSRGRALRRAPLPAGVAAALRDGRGSALAYNLEGLTDFEQAVLRAAATIPRGEVRTYAWVAREVGRPRATRAVGSALGRNPVPVLVPCHRVVRSDGRIEGYAFGTPMKRTLLDAEGVDVAGLARLAARGVHFVGSDTTHVFCVPTCAAARRITAPHRVEFRTAEAAQATGFRPCRRCRPAAVPA